MDMVIATDELVLHISIIRPAGRLDAFTVQALRDEQEKLFAQGKIYFVADLTGITFMDSAGLSALVSLLKRARQAGGGTVMIPPTDPAAYRILTLTRFDQVFTMIGSVKDAPQHLFK